MDREELRPDGEPRYLFRPVAADAVPESVWVPPVVDLTAESELREMATDGVDRAVTAAVATMPGTVALWRCWRETVEAAGPSDRVRVYLVEADGLALDPAVRVDEVIAELAGGGENAPLVEIRALEEAATTYFLRARREAALLWAREAEHPVAVARAFDGVDPDDGPYFLNDHPRLDGSERDRVLRYLEEAPLVLSSTERMVDVIEPQDGLQVPLDHRTDGRWTWTDTVPYYLRRHGLAPDPDLLDAIRANYYIVPDVSAVAWHRAIAALFGPVGS